MKKNNKLIQPHLDSVNRLVMRSAGEPVLMFWYDHDEAIGNYNGLPGFNTKQEFEGQHIAIGVLTGKPIAEDNIAPHWDWELFTGPKYQTLIWPVIWRWNNAGTSPWNMGGVYPSLEVAENTGDDPLRYDSKWRKMQIVVGVADILEWLKNHDHTKVRYSEVFAEISRHLKLPADVVMQ
jgi:hypothetical protein